MVHWREVWLGAPPALIQDLKQSGLLEDTIVVLDTASLERPHSTQGVKGLPRPRCVFVSPIGDVWWRGIVMESCGTKLRSERSVGLQATRSN